MLFAPASCVNPALVRRAELLCTESRCREATPLRKPSEQTQGLPLVRRAGATSRVRGGPKTQHEGGRHGCYDRKAGERHSDPPVQDRDPRGGPREPACPPRGHAVPREGDRRRLLPGRAARDDAGTRALLARRVRLAQVRGAAERRPAVHHRDRRAGHPLRPRPLQARGRAAGHRLARLARLVHRADEDRRSAHRPDRAWRQRVGRLPRRDPEHAGLRVLGQADHDGVGPDPHRERVGRADEAPRLRAVRGGRRRLGRRRRRGDGRRPGRPRADRAGAAGAARDPHQLRRRDSARDRQSDPDRRRAAVGSLRRRASHDGAAGLPLPARGLRG